MGNWQLEVGRMTLYIFFPIGMYYYLHQTDNVEEWMTEQKKKYNVFDEKRQLKIKQDIEEFGHQQQLKRLNELEANMM